MKPAALKLFISLFSFRWGKVNVCCPFILWTLTPKNISPIHDDSLYRYKNVLIEKYDWRVCWYSWIYLIFLIQSTRWFDLYTQIHTFISSLKETLKHIWSSSSNVYHISNYKKHVTCFVQQMQEDRGYRNDLDYDMYNHRVNRRKSLDRYAMRPGTYTQYTQYTQST